MIEPIDQPRYRDRCSGLVTGFKRKRYRENSGEESWYDEFVFRSFPNYETRGEKTDGN